MLLAIALVTATVGADEWLEKPVDESTFRAYVEFFAVDSELSLDVRVSETEVVDGVRREHLTYQSSRGERVPAFFFSAIADHNSIPRPGLIIPDPWGRLRRLAPMFVRAGWNVLTPAIEHFGERDSGLLTTFTEQDRHDALYNAKPVYLEWIVQTVKDLRRGYDVLVSERNTDPNQVVLLGVSRMAVLGMITAGAEPRLAAFVSIDGGHFDALEREHLPAACPANYVGRISPRPLLMMNGTHDADFDKDTSVQPIFDLAEEPKAIRWEERGHGPLLDDEWAFVLEWLRENVK